jgi:DNA mismatch repair protein MutS
MAGKSTFLRQNALIVLLAQAGCFVPVKAAKIGVIKQVFSKMMISDNLAENQSSFMVEMLRMAEILENADENSLLIIDELCQATNDIEGQKIAFAIIKYLLKHSKSLALITTHQPNLGFQCQDLKNIICKKIDKAHRMEGGIANYSSALEILNVAGFPKNFLINN